MWSWGSNQFSALGHDETEVEEGARVEVPRVVQGKASSSGVHRLEGRMWEEDVGGRTPRREGSGRGGGGNEEGRWVKVGESGGHGGLHGDFLGQSARNWL